MKRHLALLLALTLGACATPPKVPITGRSGIATDAWQQWRAAGRLGVIGPSQSGSGAFAWYQSREGSEVALHGPAGVGAISVSWRADRKLVTRSDGQVYAAEAALEELERQLGAALPMNALPYWLRGLPAPGEYRWEDAQHDHLQQQGWQIHFDSWVQAGAVRVPSRLQLQCDAVRITAKIQTWQVDE